MPTGRQCQKTPKKQASRHGHQGGHLHSSHSPHAPSQSALSRLSSIYLIRERKITGFKTCNDIKCCIVFKVIKFSLIFTDKKIKL